MELLHRSIGDHQDPLRHARGAKDAAGPLEKPRAHPDRIPDGSARRADANRHSESVSAMAWSSRRYGSLGRPGAKTARST